MKDKIKGNKLKDFENKETEEQKQAKDIKRWLFVIGTIVILFISIIKNGIKTNDMLESFLEGSVGAIGMCIIFWGIYYSFRLFKYLIKKLFSEKKHKSSQDIS